MDDVALGLTTLARLDSFATFGPSFVRMWDELAESVYKRRPGTTVSQILFTAGMEVDAVNDALISTIDQTRPSRAAEWGISIWESELAIHPPIGQPLDQRISTVLAKLLQDETATNKLVKQVAGAFGNGEVNVIEDPYNYTVYIQFISTRGVPPNLNDMQAAIRAAVPAHLILVFMYRYLTWLSLDARNWDFTTLDAQGLTWAEFEVLT